MEVVLKRIEDQLAEQNEAIRNLNSKVDSALQLLGVLSAKMESIIDRLPDEIRSAKPVVVAEDTELAIETAPRPMVRDRQQRRRRSLMEFPVELQSEILVRLPARSILLCRCVCKGFNNLTKNPKFIQMHLTRITPVPENPRSLFLHFGEEDGSLEIHYDHFLLSIDNTTRNVLSSLSLTPPIPIVRDLEFHVVGSCNGLICAVIRYHSGWDNYNDCNFLLWNPIIKQCRYLPKPLCTDVPDVTEFGFVAETNDYLIVKVNSSSDICVEVYKMSIDSWIVIDCNIILDDYIIIRDENSVFLNGSFHWYCGLDHCSYILYYKLNNEELGMMKTLDYDKVIIPNELDRVRDYDQQKLAVIDESLAIIFWKHDLSNGLEVWIMNEYGVEDSWAMRFEIADDIYTRLFPVGYWTDANLMINEEKEGFHLYDPNTKKGKKFPEMETTWRVVGFCSFMETLVAVR